MDENSEIRTHLQGVFDYLKALEIRARKLKNQNLADIAASAHGRVKQLVDHADTDLVADTHKDQSVNPDGSPRTDRPLPFDPKAGTYNTAPVSQQEAIERMRVDGDADPEGTARMNWPHLFEPAEQHAGVAQQPDFQTVR